MKGVCLARTQNKNWPLGLVPTLKRGWLQWEIYYTHFHIFITLLYFHGHSWRRECSHAIKRRRIVEQENCGTRGQKSWDHVWARPFLYGANYFTSEYLVLYVSDRALIRACWLPYQQVYLKSFASLECYIFIRY